MHASHIFTKYITIISFGRKKEEVRHQVHTIQHCKIFYAFIISADTFLKPRMNLQALPYEHMMGN